MNFPILDIARYLVGEPISLEPSKGLYMSFESRVASQTLWNLMV